MTKARRTEITKFCKINGLKAQSATKEGGVMLSYDTRRTSMADWVDYFDNWDDTYDFLLAAVHAARYEGKFFPWLKG